MYSINGLIMDEATGQKKYILVAEDDKFYANIYKTKLSSVGYDVLVVGDGEKAVEEARKRKPDLMLLDLVMPTMDGFEALAEIKADEKLKDIKCIILSSLSQEEDRQRARELGAVDYLVKTDLSIHEMIEKIGSHTG